MKVTLIVIDSFGIGELPDAKEYGDEGANTALHICEYDPSPKWENLKKMGLGNAAKLLGYSLPGCEAVLNPTASYGVMKEKSAGKDTTTGHWEMAGVPLEKPFHTFPPQEPSFNSELIQAFIQETGCVDILGNKSASGTAIIEELGSLHLETKFPICYTSADSVFQIACHTSVYSIEELYKMCKIARKLCNKYNVGRVIARPFEGAPGSFKRTKERADFSYELPSSSIFDHLQQEKVRTIAVGKIGSIFNEKGIDQSYHDTGNKDCLERTLQVLKEPAQEDEFVFVNLVDTDMIYGHRRDCAGYQAAVQRIDDFLPQLIQALNHDDVLIITADHGCDPSFKGTDHTREHVPLLVYGKSLSPQNVGIRETFIDVSQSIASLFGVASFPLGTSILQKR